MSAQVIVSMGLAFGDDDRSVGQYLAAFDADAYSGRGLIRWTHDKARAMRFADFEAAAECWKRQSAVRPLRPDGQPNRPLTAYSVTFEKVEANDG